MPYVLTGTVAGPSRRRATQSSSRPSTAASPVWSEGYNPSGNGREFVGYVADFYVDGANTVELYEVTRDTDVRDLAPRSTADRRRSATTVEAGDHLGGGGLVEVIAELPGRREHTGARRGRRLVELVVRWFVGGDSTAE